MMKFAFGYGTYYKETFGKEFDVANTPNINPKTIRHIVGVPNHVRAWRRNVYFEIGCQNRGLAIADDYELVVRTFLKTKMCRIRKLVIFSSCTMDSRQQTHRIFKGGYSTKG